MKKDEEIVSCVLGCNGVKDLCIPIIAKKCAEGKRVFVIYGGHVKEKLEEIGGFKFDIVHQEGIPVGMWIERRVIKRSADKMRRTINRQGKS
jgi:hypothetical protein